jgi:hypothetical protein
MFAFICRPQRPSRARPSRPDRPVTPKPASAVTPKPNRPQRPEQTPEEEAPAQQGGGRGGITAIATSYSVGDGASAKSQAVAYGGRSSGAQYRQWYKSFIF